jgi:hypothetical protein
MPSLREVAQTYATARPEQIGNVVENCPVLDILPFYPTNRGLSHVYQKYADIIGAAFMKADGIPASAKADTNLKTEDLGILAFTIESGVDTLRQLYPEAGSDLQAALALHIALKGPLIMQKSAMNTESLIMQILTAYAVQENKAIDAGGSSSGYAILATRFTQDNFCGLFNPNGFGQRALFTMVPKYGGGTYEKDGKTMIGADFKCDIDVLLDNAKCIGAVVNIDSTHKPTAENIEDIMADARIGQEGVSRLITHPMAMKYIRAIKGQALTMNVADTNVSRAVASWDGTLITPTYNFGNDGLLDHITVAQ